MSPPRGVRVLVVSATAVVTAAVVAGLFLLGPPGEERARRMDERRTEDLRRIVSGNQVFWNRNGRLASSLTELGAVPGSRLSTTDPRTGTPYEYQTMDSLRYEVCATFERESSEMYYGGVDNWSHGAGRQCFPQTVRATER